MNQQKAVLTKLLVEIQRKNSWGKNELAALIGTIMAEVIDETHGAVGDHKTHDQEFPTEKELLETARFMRSGKELV